MHIPWIDNKNILSKRNNNNDDDLILNNNNRNVDHDEIYYSASDIEANRSLETSPTTVSTVSEPSTMTMIMDSSGEQPIRTTTTTTTRMSTSTGSITPPIHTVAAVKKCKGQHDVQTSSSGSNIVTKVITAMQLSKPILSLIVCIVLLLLATTTSGSVGFFFLKFLRIPGLQNQISQLEHNVNELQNLIQLMEYEINNLTVQNDRYEQLNNNMNATIIDLRIINDQFNHSNSIYQILNEQFNNTNIELSITNSDLKNQTIQLKQMNNQFIKAIDEIINQNKVYNTTIVLLQQQNNQLMNTTKFLSNEINILSSTNQQLNNTLVRINEEIVHYTQQNQQLQLVNDDLVTIVSFLNDTSSSMNHSFEYLYTYLSQQINIQQYLLVRSIEVTYIQYSTNWDCLLYDTFRDQKFIQSTTTNNKSTTIIDPYNEYPILLQYINNRFVSSLCLNVSDLDLYLRRTSKIKMNNNTETNTDSMVNSSSDWLYPPNLTLDQMISRVNMYLTDALLYYFPRSHTTTDSTTTATTTSLDNTGNHSITDDSDFYNTGVIRNEQAEGLTTEDWVNADFRCSGLALPYRKYRNNNK